MSGVTPKYSEAPPQPSFAPVFTSSKISSAPFFVQISRRPFEEAGLRHAEADVHHDGLKDDGGDLAGIFCETALDAGEVVEGRDGNVGKACLRARRVRRERTSER